LFDRNFFQETETVIKAQKKAKMHNNRSHSNNGALLTWEPDEVTKPSEPAFCFELEQAKHPHILRFIKARYL
jgi:hypothetical protein